MHRVLVLLAMCAGIASAQWGNGYTYRASWVVQAGKITGTQSNFTFVLADTATGLKTTANGGHIQNTCTQTLYTLSVPADFLLTSDAAGTTPIAGWQFDKYSATTGAFTLHGAIGSLAAGSVVYGFYGKVAQSTCLGGAASASWDSNTLSAIAAPDGTTLNSLDYKGNTVTAGSSTPTASAGPVASEAGSIVTAGTANSYLSIAGMGNRTIPYTVCAWVNWAANTGGANDFLMGDYVDATGNNTIGVYRIASSGHMAIYTTGPVALTYHTTEGTTVINANTWHQVCAIASSTAYTLYVDGASEGTPASLVGVTLITTAQTYLRLGRLGDLGSSFWNGKQTEITVSNTVRSAGWIGAAYNNLASPTTFWAATYDQLATTSMVASPTAVPVSQTNPVTLGLIGNVTTWGGTTRFTLSGVSGVSCAASPCVPTVTDATHATISLTTIGASTGTMTITESVTGTTTATVTMGMSGGASGCAVAGVQ